MAHYAFLDANNIVTEVITGRHEWEVVDGTSDWETYYAQYRPGQTCKRTSYNGNYRKNFAGIGFHYDPVRDCFYPPQPHPSWTLNKDARWVPPVEYPTDGLDYDWSEEEGNWKAIE